MITIQGAVTLNRIASRAKATRLGDGGAIDAGLTFVGETAKRWHTAAQAKEVERQLHELAWYSRHAGGVHINSDEFDIDDGLYELSGVDTTMEPLTWGGATILRASMTLRRLGGGGTVGNNAVRRLSWIASLQTNGYSIASTPYAPIPVGANRTDNAANATRTGKDGAFTLTNSGNSLTYALSGADYTLGECKVWDTGGDSGSNDANWTRVWSPDHTFASWAHVIIDNGLVRLRPVSGTVGAHLVEVWNTSTSAWSAVTSTTGAADALALGASGMAGAMAVRIDEVTPWRVSVRWQFNYTVSPNVFDKLITLERGKHLACVEIVAPTSVAISLGLTGAGRWTIARDNARDHSASAETGLISLGVTDNWLATWAAGVNVLGVGAVRSSSSVTFYKHSGQGLAFLHAGATSFAVYLGGVPYDVAKAQGDGEDATLSGGAAAATTIAGYVGSGYAALDALNEEVSFSSLANPPAGTRVVALFRVAVSSIAAADVITMEIVNDTSVATVATLARTANNAAHFPAANTWYWFALEYTAWNGTDTIRPRATKTTSASGAAFGVDECLFVCINGGTAVDKARDAGHQAMTHLTAWPETQRRVW